VNTSFETLLYEERDGVAWVTLNRPDRMNAFQARTVDELIRCFKRAWASSEVGVVCLTGLCLRLGDYSIEPLAGMLLIGTMADEPVPLDAIRAWWESRCPDALREIDFGWQDRLDTLWYHFADCGLWTIRGDEYVLTDLGRDFTIVFINASEEGFFGEQ
jgi:hypothetical protein